MHRNMIKLLTPGEKVTQENNYKYNKPLGII